MQPRLFLPVPSLLRTLCAPMTRVNPDKVVQPTGQFDIHSAGQFDIHNASETMSAIYSPEGASLGSMRTKRIETMKHKQLTESVPADPQAIAELIARYSDATKSGTPIVASCCFKEEIQICSDQCPGRNN